MQSLEMIQNLHLIIQESSIQNRSPEPTKKKNETLVKRFLKKDAKFRNDSKLTSYHPRIVNPKSKPRTYKKKSEALIKCFSKLMTNSTQRNQHTSKERF